MSWDCDKGCESWKIMACNGHVSVVGGRGERHNWLWRRLCSQFATALSTLLELFVKTSLTPTVTKPNVHAERRCMSTPALILWCLTALKANARSPSACRVLFLVLHQCGYVWPKSSWPSEAGPCSILKAVRRKRNVKSTGAQHKEAKIRLVRPFLFVLVRTLPGAFWNRELQ